jgi:hypothetical protein
MRLSPRKRATVGRFGPEADWLREASFELPLSQAPLAPWSFAHDRARPIAAGQRTGGGHLWRRLRGLLGQGLEALGKSVVTGHSEQPQRLRRLT